MDLESFVAPVSRTFNKNIDLMGDVSDETIKLEVRCRREDWEKSPPTGNGNTRIASMNAEVSPGRRVNLLVLLITNGSPPPAREELRLKGFCQDISGIEVFAYDQKIYVTIRSVFGELRQCGKHALMAELSGRVGDYLGYKVKIFVQLLERIEH